MATVYKFAEEGQKSLPPAIFETMRAVKRYGVRAVMGRPVLSAGEIRRFALVENILNWYTERDRAEDWVTWGRANPAKAETLHKANKIYQVFFPD